MKYSPSPSTEYRVGVLLLLGALFLTTTGCGVTEYENRIGSEQARLEFFDRENQFLDAPLKWPEKKEEKKDDKAPEGIVPNEVFLRPPRGIALTPLPGGQAPKWPAAQTNPPSNFLDLQVLVVKGKGRELFQQEVLKTLGGSVSQAEKPPLKVPGREPMRFDHHRAEAGGVHLNLYFYQEGDYQAAIFYRTAKPDPATIDLSLGTLHLGLAAFNQHIVFNKRSTMGKQ